MNIAFDTQGGSALRPNEDWIAATSSTVVVLDGVTAPRVTEPGCSHSVTWFTRHLGARLVALLQEDLGAAEALTEAINQTNDLHGNACDLTSQGTPAAAVAILRERGNMLDWLVLADVAVVIETEAGIHVVSDVRVDQAAPEAVARTCKETIGTPEHHAAVAAMSVEQLKQRNVPGGYWVAAADPTAADNALIGQIPVAEVRRVALFTDGASRAVDTFGQMDWTTCLDYLQEHGPRGLIQHVRQIEECDPEGRKWPRFKKSDDATAVVVVI
jgi:hypothetical protein